jgi:hypothetical protein
MLLSAKTMANIKKASLRVLPDKVNVARYPVSDGHAPVIPVIATNVACHFTAGLMAVRDGNTNIAQYDGNISFSYLPALFGGVPDPVRVNDFITWKGVTYRVAEIHEVKLDGVVISYDGYLLLGNPLGGG